MVTGGVLSASSVAPTSVAAEAVTAGALFAAVLRWQRTLDVSGRANANTRAQYRRTLLSFFADVLADPDWEGSRDPFRLTEDDMVAYIGAIDPHGGKRNMVVRTLRSFYGWLAEREDVDGQPLILRNPMRHLPPTPEKYGPAPSLDPDELERVLVAAESVDPRARWAIELQYHTACRAGSLVAVMPTDIRRGPAGASVIFREAKNDDPYEVALGIRGLRAADELIALIDYRPPKVAQRRPTLLGVGYNQYENWVKRASEKAGVPLWSHLLRHTRITRWAEANVDVRSIMALSNWRDPTLLHRYAAASAVNLRAAQEVV